MSDIKKQDMEESQKDLQIHGLSKQVEDLERKLKENHILVRSLVDKVDFYKGLVNKLTTYSE